MQKYFFTFIAHLKIHYPSVSRRSTDGHPTVTRRSRDGGTTISRQSTDGKQTVM